MSEKGKRTFTAQVFGESLESLSNEPDEIVDKNSARSMPMVLGAKMLEKSTVNTEKNNAESLEKTTYFTPHPPPGKAGNSDDSQKKVKNKRRFARRSNRVVGVNQSNSQSSDDEKFIPEGILNNRTTGSKLPSLSRDLHHENNTNIGVDKNLKHLNPPILNKKPLSPIKDNQKLADNFKAKQSLERNKYESRGKGLKGPLKPLDLSEPVSTLQSNKSAAAVNATNIDPHEETHENDIDVNNGNDRSEDTLTSVSSDDSSDSDHESSSTSNSNLNPKAPSNPPPSYRGRRRTFSLNSVKDTLADTQAGRHSDTEAIRRERLGNEAALLPRVTVAMARDRNSNFVKEELNKYLPERKLIVFIGTWNMHGEKQVPVFVDDFLLPECSQFTQDLYVIGSQESTPLRKEWEIKLQETLGPTHVLIYSSTFGVLHLALYLRRELVWFCSAVEQATVATRPGHMIKTKGAIGLSLSIFGTSFLFINSHFTAHEQKWKERISDYRMIRKTLSLPLNYPEPSNQATDVTARFDQVFWLGDFNFRVEERHGVVEKFLEQCVDDEDPNYQELIEKDQMTRLMKKDKGVFEHFKEANINFPPTYKFDINPDDPGHYTNSRVPSWTDRIVYRSSEENGIRPLYYNCCTSINISDHRPVYGIFEASIKPVKEKISFTGVHFVRDVYIEANRRRAAPPRNQRQTAVCVIL
ncbi:72 kDa inositol polyphosphate 5-phosphatase-like [Dendronephthya gigantea]|uniref:72 kDa inositol polyphosphate 5-phosphatase-like n=1 Tax=Dendronephthya gigantea TaxID=151771 RepID=UPI00106AE705|nr:72 kDa inositol polyphosphate 5-phosphatase-like [Dendronephthya gigantea]